MHIDEILQPPVGAQFIGTSPIMSFNKLSGILEQPAKADKSAVCTINRHLLVSGLFA